MKQLARSRMPTRTSCAMQGTNAGGQPSTMEKVKAHIPGKPRHPAFLPKSVCSHA